MNIQEDLNKYIPKIRNSRDQDLCDLCLCLIRLNRVKKTIIDLDEKRLQRAIEYSHKIKRHDLTAMLRLLQALSILKVS